MELICTRCDGLGEERWEKKDMHPANNVAGWYTTLERSYYSRVCEGCAGAGFVPSGVSVPTIPLQKSEPR